MSELNENPFASPAIGGEQAMRGLGGGFHQDLTSEEGRVRAKIGAEFPDRCVKCNAPAEGYRLTRNLSWHPGWVYITLPIAILLYIIAAMATRKTASFDVGLCKEHRRRRNRFRAIWFSITGAGVFSLVMAFVVESAELGFAGFLVGFVAILVALVGSQVVTAARITAGEAVIKGCGPEFILSLH